jgi:hypothetical protein
MAKTRFEPKKGMPIWAILVALIVPVARFTPVQVLGLRQNFS